jgi:hypothetical protein
MHTSTRLTLAALLSLALVPCLAAAQGDKPDKPAKTEPEAQTTQSESKTPKPEPQTYLLTLSFKESEPGKTASTKNYTLMVISDDVHSRNENLRDGDRIPYMGEKGREYFDAGTSIDFTEILRHGDLLVGNLRVVISTLIAKADGTNLPEVNQWRINVVMALVPGKPTVVYSSTDATTGHKVEIQATAQLLYEK